MREVLLLCNAIAKYGACHVNVSVCLLCLSVYHIRAIPVETLKCFRPALFQTIRHDLGQMNTPNMSVMLISYVM